MRVYLFVCFCFPRGDRIDPVVLECCVHFLSDQKNRRAPRPPPMLIIFPKSPDQNSEIAILFTIVEKSNNYVFRDDLLPRSPRGRGFKLQTLTCVYI